MAAAITGVLATMPYVTLQLVGMQVEIAAFGLGGLGPWAHDPVKVRDQLMA